jgi:hypothetical protein
VRFPREHADSAATLSLFPIYSCGLAALLFLSAASAYAEAPKQVTAFGLALGQTPELVRSILTERVPRCAILPSIYHESAGYPNDVTAIFDIARGTLDVCRSGPGEGDVEDALSVNFAHPSIAEKQPLYQIDWERTFPDVALVPHSKIEYSFDKIRAELFRTYGRPTSQRKERITSAAADLAKSLALDKNVQREDALVRYFWASTGRMPESRDSTECDCGPRYVIAELEISRSPSTNPKNQYYALSLSIFVRDAALGARQDAWNAQWQQQKK